jgi:hypothetical protein
MYPIVRSAPWPAAERRINRPIFKEKPMKKIILAVALVVASAAPVMADSFPNLYQTQR